jgi:SPOR domain
MAGSAERTRASRVEGARRAARDRRDRIILVVGGVALVAILAIEGPGTVKQLTGSGSTPASAAAATSTPAVNPHTGEAVAVDPASPARLAHFDARDVFVPQVSSDDTTGGGIGATVVPKAPDVRARDFVAKNPFIPQISAPASTPSTNGSGVPGSTSAESTTTGSGSFIVVLGSASDQRTAARAIVAAKNAGLKNVAAAKGVLPSSKNGAFTVFTGPYPSPAEAQSWLVRATKDGYPNAVTRKIGGAR